MTAEFENSTPSVNESQTSQQRQLDMTCPVCRARFRSQSRCTRCATDLAPLMRIMVQAWLLRGEAKQQLDSRCLAEANSAAQASIALHSTKQGRQLTCLILMLKRAAQYELGQK